MSNENGKTEADTEGNKNSKRLEKRIKHQLLNILILKAPDWCKRF